MCDALRPRTSQFCGNLMLTDVESIKTMAYARKLTGVLDIVYFSAHRTSRYVIVPSRSLYQCGMPGGITITSPFVTCLLMPF